MQIETATVLIDLMMRQTAELNEILKDVQAREPTEEFLKVRDMIGRVMGALYGDAMYHILEEHPDLKPLHLR